jgi:hypothetical protein
MCSGELNYDFVLASIVSFFGKIPEILLRGEQDENTCCLTGIPIARLPLCSWPETSVDQFVAWHYAQD